MKALKRTAYIAVFGAVWGGAEMFLGSALHTLHFPLRGLVMASVAVFILCCGNFWIGGKLTSIYLGIISAFLKVFSIGGVILTPMVAILMESLIAEMVFRLLGDRLSGCIVTGIALSLYTIVHKVISLFVVYHAELSDFSEIFTVFQTQGGMVKNHYLLLILAYVGFHILAGSIVGFIAYLTAHQAKKRLVG